MNNNILHNNNILLINYRNSYLLKNIPSNVNILKIETFFYNKILLENLPDNIEELTMYNFTDVNDLNHLPSSIKILILNKDRYLIKNKNIFFKKLPKLLKIIIVQNTGLKVELKSSDILNPINQKIMLDFL